MGSPNPRELEIVCDAVGKRRQLENGRWHVEGHRVHYQFGDCRLDTEADLLKESQHLVSIHGPDIRVTLYVGKGVVYHDVASVVGTLVKAGFKTVRFGSRSVGTETEGRPQPRR